MYEYSNENDASKILKSYEVNTILYESDYITYSLFLKTLEAKHAVCLTEMPWTVFSLGKP